MFAVRWSFSTIRVPLKPSTSLSTTCLVLVRDLCMHIFAAAAYITCSQQCVCVPTLLKIKVSKGRFHSSVIEEQFWVPQRTFLSEQFLRGASGFPFSTSWYDCLGSSWNVCNILWLKFLNGHVNQHPFYLVKNSSVHSDPFRFRHVSLNDNELLLTPPLSSVLLCIRGQVTIKNKTNPLRPQWLWCREKMKTVLFTFTSNYKTPALLTKRCRRYSCSSTEKMADSLQLAEGGNMLIRDSPSAVVGLIIETV